MSRIDLQVPFSEKDEAQRLGARWDPRQRVWYVPAGVDPAPLQQWCPRPPTPNIRSPRYFLATTTRDCWHCAASTRVVAIVLPEGHEAFYVGDDPADDCWQESGLPVVLSDVAYLTDPVAALLRSLAPHYRIDFSKTTTVSETEIVGGGESNGEPRRRRSGLLAIGAPTQGIGGLFAGSLIRSRARNAIAPKSHDERCIRY